VKRSIGAPHPSKGFHLASQDVGATRKVVVYPGREAYRLDTTTEVMPVAMLEREVAGK
jgi:hypothetical protein